MPNRDDISTEGQILNILSQDIWISFSDWKAVLPPKRRNDNLVHLRKIRES